MATVESMRLDPDLKRDLLLRAAEEHTRVSEVIRAAVRRSLTQLIQASIATR